MKDDNPWLDPWLPLTDRETLTGRLAYSPPPLTGLDRQPAKLAAIALNDALKGTFVVSEQVLNLCETIVAAAVHHLTYKYSSASAYCREVTSRITAGGGDFIPPIPVTGHAGVGKTAIFEALLRAIGHRPPITIGGITALPEPLKLVPVGIAKSQLEVVRRVGGLGHNLEVSLPSARRLLYGNGTAFLSFGETQFVNQSAAANTLVASILLLAGTFGIPTAYDANFSLMWRLRRRPPEERDRLLHYPTVIFPEIPGEKDAIAVTQAMIDVAPEIFEIDPNRDGIDLEFRCGGLKRAKRRLLVLAYQMKRETSRKSTVRVTINDIRDAYKSIAFNESRLIVEELARRQDHTRTKKNDDLACPFDEPLSAAEARKLAANRFRNEQIAEREVDSALTTDEKHLLAKNEGLRMDARTRAGRVPAPKKERVTGSNRAANSATLAATYS